MLTEIAAISLGLSSLGAGLDIYGTLNAGKAAENANRLNAAAFLGGIKQVDESTNLKLELAADEYDSIMGSQKAALAETVGSGTATGEAFINDTIKKRAMNATLIRMEGEQQKYQLRSEAINQIYAGKQARTASKWQAGTSILTSSANLANMADRFGLAG